MSKSPNNSQHYLDESKSNRDKQKKLTTTSPLQPNQTNYGTRSNNKNSNDKEIRSPLLSEEPLGFDNDDDDDIRHLGLFQTPQQHNTSGSNLHNKLNSTPSLNNNNNNQSFSRPITQPQPSESITIIPRPATSSPIQRQGSASMISTTTSTTTRPQQQQQQQQQQQNTTNNNTNDNDTTTPQKPNNIAAVKRMLGRMSSEKSKIIIGVTGMAIASLCTLAVPLAVGKLVDILGKTGVIFADVKKVLYIAMIVIVINAIANFVQMSLLWVAGDKIVATLRIELFKSLIYRDISFFDTARVGELLSRLSTDVAALNQALTVEIAELGQRIAVVGGSLIYMLYLSWDLSLIVFCVAPIIGVTAHKLARFFHIWIAKVNDALALSSIVAEETLSNMRTIRSLSMEYTQQLRYNEKIITSYRLNRKQKLMKSAQRTFVYFTAGCAVVGVLWYGSWKVIGKQLTPGDLLTFIVLGLQVGENSGRLLDNWVNITTAASACSICLDLIEDGHNNCQLYLEFKDITEWHRVTNEIDFDKVLDNMGKQSKKDNVIAKRGKHMEDAVTAGTTLIIDPTVLPVLQKLPTNLPIIFNNVHFSYPSRPNHRVLDGINIQITPKSQVAFVGASGSGKSSAISVLLRMYNIDSGAIQLGEENINDINEVLWRSSISYVEQLPTLFNTTIVDNVLTSVCHFKLHDCDYTIEQIKQEREAQKSIFASNRINDDHGDIESNINNTTTTTPYNRRSSQQRPGSADSSSSFQQQHHNDDDDQEIICPCHFNHDLPLCQDLFGRVYTMRDVQRACELASAHDFITEFPEGYYTKVGDRSVQLSGGQRQRISIARCFLKDSQIVLLDEVSSALDLVNEDIITNAINKLILGKTVITIAHRLSTIKNVDTIYVFKNGVVIEQGTHAELMGQEGGAFKQLVELQQLVQATQAAQM